MISPSKRLSEAELDIMLIVWEKASPITASYILEHLKETRSWSLQTMYTVLSRLENKGYITCDKKGRNKTYIAIISEDNYKQSEVKTFLKRVYNNSVKNMVVSLYHGDVLSDKDVSELREFLNKIEGDMVE